MRDDPADYGTAFGLELSVGPATDDPLPTPVPVPRPSGGGWWTRWRQRGA